MDLEERVEWWKKNASIVNRFLDPCRGLNAAEFAQLFGYPLATALRDLNVKRRHDTNCYYANESAYRFFAHAVGVLDGHKLDDETVRTYMDKTVPELIEIIDDLIVAQAVSRLKGG